MSLELHRHIGLQVNSAHKLSSRGVPEILLSLNWIREQRLVWYGQVLILFLLRPPR